MRGLSWDIFCNVVDNYGDIGVTWRLARQLAAEHGFRVRLWVDELSALQKIAPEIDPLAPSQSCRGVEVCHWAKAFPEAQPADVVIEAFACALPERYVAAMAVREPKPLWINLEYLSAEDWVPGCHGMASPHPRLPLTKYFYFPGFVAGTGGLLCETGMPGRARSFSQDAAARAGYWHSLGLPAPRPEEARISLFGYENPATAGLLEAWAGGAHPVTCLVPEGRIAGDVGAFFGASSASPGDAWAKGKLRVHILPFTDQDGYDTLLWACDCNFVRGEDSFVRAQWAARPFVWQIYPQEENAHWKKLSAFMALYCAELQPEVAASLRAFWEAWNRQDGAGAAWAAFWRQRVALDGHARRWAERLQAQGDLASRLVQFCENKLK